MRRRPNPELLIGAAAVVVAIAVTFVQLRGGIRPVLDTATYWSGADQFRHGHPFTTRLAPSFSNFDAVDFVGRGGRIPFVDFPIGYPLLAGILALVIGARPAMEVLVVAAAALSALALVVGAPSGSSATRRLGPRAAAAIVGAALTALQIGRAHV